VKNQTSVSLKIVTLSDRLSVTMLRRFCEAKKRYRLVAFQFIHLESYSRVSKKPSGTSVGSKSIRSIIAEVDREEHACPHIKLPKKPIIVFGQSPSVVEKELMLNAEQAKDPLGRKIRRDTHILLAGVASYPTPISELENSLENEGFQSWLKLNIAFLKNEFGNNLKSIIVHQDETYPHIHFYSTPRRGEPFNLNDIHPGKKEQEKHLIIRGDKNNRKERVSAYKNGLRQFQDRYHEHVGSHLGLTRIGPKRRRLSRAAWKAEKCQFKAKSRTLNKAKRFAVQAREKISNFEDLINKSFQSGYLKGLLEGKNKILHKLNELNIKLRQVSAERDKAIKERDNLYKIIKGRPLLRSQELNNEISPKF
jgi:Plasmid recombination enzyme